jgi:hypothetical protein
VEEISHLGMVDSVFDIWKHLVEASHIDYELGVVSLNSPVSSLVRPSQVLPSGVGSSVVIIS